MKYTEIVELLDKGFTPEQIMQLHVAPVPVQDPAQVQDTKPGLEQVQEQKLEMPMQNVEPDWAKELNKNIQRMTNAIYAQNIAQDISGQGSQPPETAEQILTGLIK